MCRICGRALRCIFDTMPSRIPITSTQTSSIALRTRPLQQITTTRSEASRYIHTALRTGRKSQHAQSTFMLPIRSALHQASATQQATLSASDNNIFSPSLLDTTHSIAPATSNTDLVPPAQNHSKPLVISRSLQSLLPSLSAQKPHYITAHIHRFPYLLQAGDTLRLPFYMKEVAQGDILRLNRVSVLGSRDYTLKAGSSSTETYDQKRTGEPNYLDERLFEVRARVVGVESGPMFIKEKTKRRNRRVKTVKSKHRHTVLKIMEVKVKELDELMQEQGTVLLES